MCGIAGILQWHHPPDRQTAERMASSMRHRGPDAEQVVVLPRIALAHRRLAVIDLNECANQPLADVSRQFWIVYNGELYNFRDLRQELARGGASFATDGDTEVVLEAFKRWGSDCVHRLVGMFAFAIWDARKEALVLARDRAGAREHEMVEGQGGEGGARLGAARDHRDFRGVEVPRKEFREAIGDTRGELRRLQYRAIAGGQDADQGRRRQVHRVVPGRDDPD